MRKCRSYFKKYSVPFQNKCTDAHEQLEFGVEELLDEELVVGSSMVKVVTQTRHQKRQHFRFAQHRVHPAQLQMTSEKKTDDVTGERIV